MGSSLAFVRAGAEDIHVGGGPGVLATESRANADPNITEGDRGEFVREAEVIPFLSHVGEIGYKLPVEKLSRNFGCFCIVAESSQ